MPIKRQFKPLLIGIGWVYFLTDRRTSQRASERAVDTNESALWVLFGSQQLDRRLGEHTIDPARQNVADTIEQKERSK